MKRLSDYTKEAIATLLDKYNGFFAFSVDQFNEGKKDGLKYVARGAGLYHEAGKSKEFDKEYNQVILKGIELDLKENGKEKIIDRELKNYECYYTGEIDDAIENLADYGITEKEVEEVYNKNVDKYEFF